MERQTPRIENWETFEARLRIFPQQDQENIEWAYQTAKRSHDGDWREEEGVRYFEHPRHVTLIYLDELQGKNPRMVIASLLHDAPEDTPIFGTYQNRTYPQWAHLVQYRVGRMFDDETARMVVDLTKPPLNGIDVLTEEQSEAIYLANLAKTTPEALVIKMADRLHNARTFGALAYDRAMRKIVETRRDYYPLFEKAAIRYPQDTGYLMGHLEEIFQHIENQPY